MNINEMKKQFFEVFGETAEEIRIFTSPGRVNLIGEHVDYCGGHVLPAALTMKTTLLARKRNDDILRLKATDLDIIVETKISEAHNLKGKLKWGDYQLGVALELIKDGYDLCGCDLLYDDTVPHGGGLSSSAAIEVSTALCFATFANEKKGATKKIDMIEMALISQRAEYNFIGVKCGIMDQFASAMGKANHAIYLDCATLNYKHIPLNTDGYKLVLTNTNVKHSLGSSKYNERREECEKGLNALKTVLPEIACLAEVTEEQFEKHNGVIEDEIVRKRIRHVVSECARVKKSAEALTSGDMKKFGEYLNLSHDSLQYDYEVTCPELDFVVAKGREIPGVLGIRMTGAGFGGCTVSVINDDAIDKFIKTVGDAYIKEFGHEASFYITEIGDGGREIK
ncbi:MAG: galactokinase [Clostridia bacterium]|nr:galactokinase [Clostridia bacterium]